MSSNLTSSAVKEKFSEHVSTLLKTTREALESNGFERLIIHAGTPQLYYADDQEIPFRTVPHFMRFVPSESPHHLLCISKNKSMLVEVVPDDYWLEQGNHRAFWKDCYDVTQVKTPEATWKALPFKKEKIAFIGDAAACRVALLYGIPKKSCNPKKLLEALDTSRAIKTPYEIICIEKANERAAVGHTAARSAFFEGKSERDIHYAYLKAIGAMESELPYPTIVALNEKAATLHYQHKRVNIKDASVLLIDAGAKENGYASDITRTHFSQKCDSRFVALHTELETLQKKLSEMVRPNIEFIELHHHAHMGIASILKNHNLINVDGVDAIERGLTRTFFPHGLGHMLGIQVHDVGGRVIDDGSHPLYTLYPKIRTHRKLKIGNVTTIEPGIYFNEILLGTERAGTAKKYFNWKQIDELMPSGGMRIEDNIVVTENGARNITRPFLP